MFINVASGTIELVRQKIKLMKLGMLKSNMRVRMYVDYIVTIFNMSC